MNRKVSLIILKTLLSLLGIVLFLFTPLISNAQEIKCGTDAAMDALEQMHLDNPGKFSHDDHIMNHSQKQIIIGSGAPCEEHYVIPVIFHVFRNNGSSVVPIVQIQRGLDKANEDLNLLNADANSIDPMFTGRKAGINISLELAQLDPGGNATDGVQYYPTSAGFGGINMNNTVASYAWDNYKYLNIYLMLDLYDDGTTNNSGVAWLPDTWMSNNGLARIVYNYIYLGYGGSSVADPEFQSVFTHEVGHYLGLSHTFKNFCNAPGDGVDDTPPTQGSAGCGPNAWSCGNLTNGENYMDYNVSCYKMFTQGQVHKMKEALSHPTRAPLWQESNLQATGLWNLYAYPNSAPEATFEVTDTIIYEGDNVRFTDFSCRFATSWSWTFNGGAPAASSATTETVQYNVAGTYTASLVVSNGNGASVPATVSITVLPQQTCMISEGYENTPIGSLPPSWQQNVSGGIDFEVEDAQVVNTGSGTATTYSQSGNKAIYSPENWDASGPVSLRLISGQIDLTGVSQPKVSWWDMRGWDNVWPQPKPEHMIDLEISSSSSGPWTRLGTDTTHQSEFLSWRRSNDYDLSAYAGQQIYLSWVTSAHHYYWRIDDLCVFEAVATGIEEGLEEEPYFKLQDQILWVYADQFQLFDLQGRQIVAGDGHENTDLSFVAKGIYVLRMFQGKGITNKKIMIHR